MNANLLRAAEAADVIGIGEDAHGELVSWPTRLCLTRALCKRGYDVVILCEQLHPFVARMNDKRFKLLRAEDNDFVPYMTGGANMSKEHTSYHRRFHALAHSPENKVRFVGIDVQIVEHAYLWDVPDLRPNDETEDYNETRAMIHRYEKEFLRDAHKDSKRGATRNKVNARIISELVESSRKASKRPTKFLYFAHNGHVARSISFGPDASDKCYRPDGWHLARCDGFKYLAIATYALYLPNVWGMIPSTPGYNIAREPNKSTVNFVRKHLKAAKSLPLMIATQTQQVKALPMSESYIMPRSWAGTHAHLMSMMNRSCPVDSNESNASSSKPWRILLSYVKYLMCFRASR